MTPLLFLLTALAGGVGAAARYALDIGVMTLTRRGRFPWGVFTINVLGSFLLGLLTAALPDAAFVLGVGLLGGFTTFSTAMLDAVVLWQEGQRRAAVSAVLGMLAFALFAAALGLAWGAAL